MLKFIIQTFRNLKFTPFRADIFFLDPPYNKFKIPEILESIRNAGLINNKSIGVLELPKSTLQNELSYLKIIKEKKKYPIHCFYFLK